MISYLTVRTRRAFGNYEDASLINAGKKSFSFSIFTIVKTAKILDG